MNVKEATQQTNARAKVALAGAAAGLALLAFTSGSALASGGVAPQSAGSASQEAPAHEQMHGMMNSVHGEGTSQKMHEAMGPQAEKMMDQCAPMMGNMQNMGDMDNMQGTMDGAMMGGMMNGGMQSGDENQYQGGQ